MSLDEGSLRNTSNSANEIPQNVLSAVQHAILTEFVGYFNPPGLKISNKYWLLLSRKLDSKTKTETVLIYKLHKFTCKFTLNQLWLLYMTDTLSSHIRNNLKLGFRDVIRKNIYMYFKSLCSEFASKD